MDGLYTCPTVPEACEDWVSPAIQSEYCPENVELELSEIKRVFMAQVDPTDASLPLNGPTDWNLEADWAGSIDNTTDDKIRALYGMGDKPEPERTTVTVHDNQEVDLPASHTVNFSVMDMNLVNYEALRAYQHGATVFFWFETRGGGLYGGQNGIKARVRAFFTKERGNEAYHQGNLVFTWTHKCDPEKIVSPIPEVIIPVV